MEIRKAVTPRYGTNCYLLSGEDFAVIIDPGEETKEIIDFCRDNIRKSQKAVLLTHCHFDHISGVPALVKIWENAVFGGIFESEGFLDNSINLSGAWASEKIAITPDILLSDKEEIPLGDEKITVIHTPGHTKGSVSYLFGNILFCGDTVFKNSVGRTDLPTADNTEFAGTLDRIMSLPDDTILLPGHGTQTTVGEEKENNPYLKYFI